MFLLVSLLVLMDLPTFRSCSWPFRVVLMLVLRAQALNIVSGLAAPTHTAMMIWRPGQRSALAPAPTPAQWAAVFHLSCPSRMIWLTQTCTWSTRALAHPQKWPQLSRAFQRWPVPWAMAAQRMWWRTFWTISTCSHQITQDQLEGPVQALTNHPPHLCYRAALDMHRTATSNPNKTTASACIARPAWETCPLCPCKIWRASPLSQLLLDPWGSLTAQRGCLRSSWHLIQTHIQTWFLL